MTRHSIRRRALAALVTALGLLVVTAPVTASDDPAIQEERRTAGVSANDLFRDPTLSTTAEALAEPIDIVQQQPPLSAQYMAPSTEFTGDPLGLVVYPLESRRYTLGTDKIGVYVCTWPGASGTVDLAAATAVLNGAVKDYFVSISGGRYTPSFTARKTVTISGDNEFDCEAAIAASPSVTTDNAIMGVLNNKNNGGVATSGQFCALPCSGGNEAPSTYPANQRWAIVDGGSLSTPDFVFPFDEPHLTTAVHEVGHTLGWPHSYSAETFNQYDNPIDVMSANATEDFVGRTDTPYATVAWNRYRAGWIDTSDVLVYTGGVKNVTLAPAGVAGLQMIVLPTEGEWSFITLDARRSLGVDGIPDAFEGVSAHYAEQVCLDPLSGQVVLCWGTAAGLFSYPPSPDAIDHVVTPGETLSIDLDQGEPAIADGSIVKILSGSDAGYVVRLVGFADIGGTNFLNDIIWLADEGITLGCNPPDNTNFCPGNGVTRGQMAAFLVRALGLTAIDPGIDFIDDNASIFEADIEKLATAGITFGCNPPDNTKFCPDQSVSRGQMAAFLVRAFGLTDRGTTDFLDDDGSIFEADIEKLATAGITLGCNPPANTNFCPGNSVTRGQMAAFLKRSEPFLP